MGSVLDVFNGDAYGLISLTEGIDKIPYTPGRIGSMGLFKTEGVFHTDVKIEERHGKLNLVPTAARGTMPEFDTERVRQARSFAVPHLPKNDSIMADDIQDIRAFNSDNKNEAIGQVMADKLEQLKNDHAATWEFQMAKAIEGIVLDADGTSVIYNWFTEFGIDPKEVTITNATADDVQAKCNEIRRHIIDALGGESFTGIHVFCNAAFMDAFQSFDEVKAAYDRWNDGAFLRQDNVYNSFSIHDIVFEEYRNVRSIDVTDASTNIDIPYIGVSAGTAVGYAIPLGTRNVFKRYNAPGTFVESVGTKGKDIYVKQVRNKWDTGIDIHTQSNPLIVNTRPATSIKISLA